MLQKIFGLLKLPFVRAGLLLAGLALMGSALWLFSRAQVPPEQPIQFPHDKHLQWGIQCLYCHPGALRGPSAGLPTQAKCWGCHQQINRSTPELDTLRSYVESGEPIPWVPVALLPDFVHFNHRPHVAAGLNCETCHGDLSHASLYENPQVLNMGWCLDCHRTRSEGNPELRTRLLDCATCHY